MIVVDKVLACSHSFVPQWPAQNIYLKTFSHYCDWCLPCWLSDPVWIATQAHSLMHLRHNSHAVYLAISDCAFLTATNATSCPLILYDTNLFVALVWTVSNTCKCHQTDEGFKQPPSLQVHCSRVKTTEWCNESAPNIGHMSSVQWYSCIYLLYLNLCK